MTKDNLLNQWLWKWHVIAGLITLPVMFLLAITGTIYLFKDNINNQIYYDTKFVEGSANKQRLLLSEQLLAVQNSTKSKVVGVQLPKTAEEATAFQVAGKGRAKNNVYVDPYSGEVQGSINQKETFMYTIRKLHGELLLNKVGTTIVELVASWFIVLILTGLYIWWPKKGTGLGGFLTIRFSQGKRMLYRDLHAVLGFWLSIFLLIILAGGMPWTDVFGSQLKWVQKQTDTGYPQHWRNAKGLVSAPQNIESLQTFASKPELIINQKTSITATKFTIDEVNHIAQSYNLDGVISIQFPSSAEGVYTITNRALLLRDQQVFHINQYSGEVIKSLQWSDVGALMDLRQVFMRLHQGEYGLVSWVVLLTVALLFAVSIIAGFASYIIRKPQGSWGIPRVPKRFRADKLLVAFIIILGAVFPLFGASLLVIYLWEKMSSIQTSRHLKASRE